MTATAKLFKNGRSQAVRLPAEFRFEGTEVNIRRDPLTGEVILSPKLRPALSWNEVFRLRDAIPAEELEGFMDDRDQGVHERDDPLA
jgi:antitoxin VapB